MTAGQGLRGLVGQSMSGSRPTLTPEVASYGPGTHTYRAPATGWFRFVLWGGGGNGAGGTTGGGSGSLVIAERSLVYNEAVAVVCGLGEQDTTVSFRDHVFTAGAGQDAVPGVASIAGGTLPADMLINGSAPGVAGSGSGGGAAGGAGGGNGGGAPGVDGYHGGKGAADGSGVAAATAPGAGGGGFTTAGAIGLVLIHRVRLRQ